MRSSFPNFEYGILTLAELEEGRRQYSTALAYYRMVLQINAQSIIALDSVGRCLMEKKKWRDARAAFEKVIVLEPNHKDANENLSKIRRVDYDKERLKRIPLAKRVNDFCMSWWTWHMFTHPKLWSIYSFFNPLKKSSADPNEHLDGFIDKSGEIVFRNKSLTVSADYSEFSQGLFCNQDGGRQATFINRTGNQAFEGTFDCAQSFSEDLAAVLKENKWGFIDPTGQYVIEPRFEEAMLFSQGLAAVQENSKWGFIDKAGEWVIHPVFEGVTSFFENRSAVRLNGKVGFIDSMGKFVIDPKFDEASCFSEGLARVVVYEGSIQRHLVSFISHDGDVVIDLNKVLSESAGSDLAPYYGISYFDESSCFNLFSYQSERAENSPQSWTYRPYNGVACTFQDRLFQNGLLKLCVNDKFGYIDQKGNFAIAPQFFSASSFSEGLALVSADAHSNDWWNEDNLRKQKFGFVDITGSFVIPPIYSKLSHSFSDGLARVHLLLGNRDVFIDQTGAIVLDVTDKKGRVGNFHEGLAPIEGRRRTLL